jgi:hypothetical protein
VRTFFKIIVILLLILNTRSSFAQDKVFRQKVYDSSIQLFILEDDSETGHSGKMSAAPQCTAQAFRKTEKGYLLLTAAHCVVNEHEGLLPYDEPAEDGTLFADYGDPGSDHTLMPVTIQIVGDHRRGWDIAVLNLETTVVIPVIPLGDDTLLNMGDRLVSVSAPLGGDIKYWFEGYVSAFKKQVDPESTSNCRNFCLLGSRTRTSIYTDSGKYDFRERRKGIYRSPGYGTWSA